MNAAIESRRRHLRSRNKLARKPLSVGIILADHFTLSSFSLFVDVLRLAADEGDFSRPLNVQWSIMSARAEPVLASCGAPVGRTSALVDPRNFDYVAIVGGILHAGRQVDPQTEQYLRDAARAGVPLIGVCTGSFVLARIGLMTGKRSCVSWYHHQDFIDEFPGLAVVADRMFVADGDRITCVGGAGAADLATHLVERRLGRAVAQKARQIMQFERSRAGEEAQPHPPVSAQVADARVRRALLLMEQNLARPMPISDLAAHLDLSQRQLERLFRSTLKHSPAAAYRTVRMRYAAWLLRNTNQPVTEIAAHAGFSDCAHFSRQFRRQHGFSPSKRRGVRSWRGSELAASRVFE
jgi:transcriptional regulator GlxA family with amidase domain